MRRWTGSTGLPRPSAVGFDPKPSRVWLQVATCLHLTRPLTRGKRPPSIERSKAFSGDASRHLSGKNQTTNTSPIFPLSGGAEPTGARLARTRAGGMVVNQSHYENHSDRRSASLNGCAMNAALPRGIDRRPQVHVQPSKPTNPLPWLSQALPPAQSPQKS